MNNVSIRELRNHGGEVIERVERGDALWVTRDGPPVAELRPLEAARLTLPVLLARFRGLPPMDPGSLRDDIDKVTEASFEPIPFDAAAARAFGRVAAELRRSGRKRKARSFDAMIAATALARDLRMFTANAEDFMGIDRLEVVSVGVQ